MPKHESIWVYDAITGRWFSTTERHLARIVAVLNNKLERDGFVSAIEVCNMFDAPIPMLARDKGMIRKEGSRFIAEKASVKGTNMCAYIFAYQQNETP